MPRKSSWPPAIKIHEQRQLERVWWAGQWHYLGPVGSEQAKAAYADLIRRITGGELPQGVASPERRTAKPSTEPTVNDVLALWWRYAESR